MKATTKKAKTSPSKSKPAVGTKKAGPQKATPSRPVAKKVATKKIVKKVTAKNVAASSSTGKSLNRANSTRQSLKVKDKKKQEGIAQPPVSAAQSVINEEASSVLRSSQNRSVGKVARAVAPSGLSTIKDNKKTVTERALISQNFNTAPNILENDEGADPGFMQNDEVFDETDYAQHLQLMEQAEVSRRARELNRPQVHPDFDGVHCVECDIEIPKLRLDAGRVRCVECQQEIETESKRLYNLERGRG